MTGDSDPSAFASEDLDVRVRDDELVVYATITCPESRNALNHGCIGAKSTL